MSVEAKIHELWSSYASEIPVARVFTGPAPPDTAFPYCAIYRDFTVPLTRSNVGRVLQAQFSFHVWDENFDRGSSAALEILTGWHGAEFAVDSITKVIAMRRAGLNHIQELDGTWHFLARVDAHIAIGTCAAIPTISSSSSGIVAPSSSSSSGIVSPSSSSSSGVVSPSSSSSSGIVTPSSSSSSSGPVEICFGNAAGQEFGNAADDCFGPAQ